MDYADLGINVRSQGATEATGKLDALEASAGKVERSITTMQNRIETSVGVLRTMGKSASDSAAAFRSFDVIRDKVDQLQVAYGNLSQEELQHTAALRQLDAAYDQGVVGLSEYQRMTDTVQTALLAVGTAADATGLSVTRMQHQINMATGVLDQHSRSAKESASVFQEFDKARAQINNLRASYDPLFAAEQRRNNSIQQLNAALAADVITQDEHAAAMTRVASAYDIASTQARQYGMAMGAARANTTNMVFQLQDIAMMTVAGQAPLLLAAQQGTQVAGVFMQMEQSGQGMAAGLRSAFMSLISPMSLVTVALVAGFAALGQWALGLTRTGEETEDASKRVSEFTTVLTDYARYADTALASTIELSEEFGVMAEEVRAAAETMMVVSMDRARDLVEGAVTPIRDSVSEMTQLQAELSEAQRQMQADMESGTFGTSLGSGVVQSDIDDIQAAIDSLSESIGVLPEDARSFVEALQPLSEARTMQEFADSASDAERVLSEIVNRMADEGRNIPAPLESAAEFLEQIIRKGALAVDAQNSYTDSIRRSRDALDAFAGTSRSVDVRMPSAEGLVDEYGVLVTLAKEELAVQRQIAAEQSSRSINQAVEEVRRLLPQIVRTVDEYRHLADMIDQVGDASSFEGQARALQQLRRGVVEVAGDMGSWNESTFKTVSGLTQAALQAAGLARMTDTASGSAAFLESIVSRFPGLFASGSAGANGLANSIFGAAQAASSLASALSNAVSMLSSVGAGIRGLAAQALTAVGAMDTVQSMGEAVGSAFGSISTVFTQHQGLGRSIRGFANSLLDAGTNLERLHNGLVTPAGLSAELAELDAAAGGGGGGGGGGAAGAMSDLADANERAWYEIDQATQKIIDQQKALRDLEMQIGRTSIEGLFEGAASGNLRGGLDGLLGMARGSFMDAPFMQGIVGSVGAVLGPMMPIIGGISTAMNLINGFSSREKVGETTTTRGVLGMGGGLFEQIREEFEKTSFWGLKTSREIKTSFRELDDQTQQAREAFGGFISGVRDAGAPLGIVADRFRKLRVPIVDGDIAGAMGEMDRTVARMIPGFIALQNEGETVAQTLGRLSGALTTYNGAAAVMRLPGLPNTVAGAGTAASILGDINLGGAESALFGMMDPGDQMSAIRGRINREMRRLGLSGPITDSDQLLSRIENASDAGRARAAAALASLAPLVGQLDALKDGIRQTQQASRDAAAAAREQAEAQRQATAEARADSLTRQRITILGLQDKEAEARKLELSLMEPYLRAGQEQIWQLQDAAEAERELTRARDAATRAAEEARRAIDADDFRTAWEFMAAVQRAGRSPYGSETGLPVGVPVAGSGSPMVETAAKLPELMTKLEHINTNLILIEQNIRKSRDSLEAIEENTA